MPEDKVTLGRTGITVTKNAFGALPIQRVTQGEAVLLLRRSPSAAHLSEAGQARMKKIEGCLHCGRCKEKCPYGLDTPALLARNYEDYCRVLAGEASADSGYPR